MIKELQLEMIELLQILFYAYPSIIVHLMFLLSF